MLKKGAQSLVGAGRCALSTSTSLQQAVPAVAAAPKSKGLLASLFGGSDRITTPLTDALPGVVLPEHVPAPKDAPKTEMTTLSNGFRVASENTPVSLHILDAAAVLANCTNAHTRPSTSPITPHSFHSYRAPPRRWVSMLTVGACTRALTIPEYLTFWNTWRLRRLAIARTFGWFVRWKPSAPM